MIGPIEDRLWARVAKGGPDECWPWLGARHSSGHGQISRPGRHGVMTFTHRVAYEAAVGPIPDGLVVRHTCDNPPCCNPAHLLTGTARDNVHDSIRRGRIATGFMLPWTRLSEDDVRYIREHFRRVSPRRSNCTELAEMFGVSRDYIASICRGVKRRSVA